MKKLTLFLSALLICVTTFAASIGAPASIDFGTYNLFNLEEVEDSLDINMSPSEISSGGIYLEVLNDPEGVFYVKNTWAYPSGYVDYHGKERAKIYFYALEAGTYEATLRLGAADTYNSATNTYSVYQDVALKVVVVNEKPKTTTYELVTSSNPLKDGDVVVFANTANQVIAGEFDGAALVAVSDIIYFDTEKNTVEVPASATTFTANKYSGGFQFTNTATSKKLLLDVTSNNGKGAFSYEDGLATWSVEVDNKGEAIISRNSDNSYPVNCVSGSLGYRFKPYKTDQNVYVNLYKKAGEEQTVTTTFSVNPSDVLDFGQVEAGSGVVSKNIVFSATNLGENIEVIISGDDETHFTLDESKLDGAKGGTLVVNFKNDLVAGDYKTTLMYSAKDIDNKPLDGEILIKVKVVAQASQLNVPATVDLGSSEYDGNNKSASKNISITASHIDSNQGYLLGWENDSQATFTYNDNSLPKDCNGTLKISLADGVSEVGKYEEKLMIYAIGQDAVEHTKSITVTYEITEQQQAPAATGVVISQSTLSLQEDATATLTAIVQPSDAEQNVVWESDNEAVATVANGVVTAIAEGTANITVKVASNLSLTDICVVNVTKKQEPVKVWYSLVSNATTLQDGDKIVFAINTNDVKAVAGDFDNNGLKVVTEGVEFDGDKVAAANALVFELEEVEGGWNLKFADGTLGVNTSKANLNKTGNNGVWTFEADQTGVYALNATQAGKGLRYNPNNGSPLIRYYNSNYANLYVYTLTPHEAATTCNNIQIEGITFMNNEIQNPEGKQLNVYNANGMLVVTSTTNINMSGFAQGLYIIRCGKETMKVIK